MKIERLSQVAVVVLVGALIACGGSDVGGGGTGLTSSTSSTSSTGTNGFGLPKKTQIVCGATDAPVNGTISVSGRIEYQQDNGSFAPLADHDVSVTGALNGSSVSDANGEFAVEIPIGLAPPGARSLTVQFDGDGGYLASSKSVVCNITKGSVELTGSSSYSVRHSQRFDLDADARDGFGTGLSIPISISGSINASGSSNEGFTSFNLDSSQLAPGVHSLVLSSPGNIYFESSPGFNISVTVSQGIPLLQAANFSASRGTTKNYRIRVLDEQSRPVFGSPCVLDILDGPNYSATTGSDGYATFKIVLDTDWRVGNHGCKITVSATGNFKSATKNVNMTVQ